MTPEDAVSEYHRVIADYDARYREDPLEKRQREREAERLERRQHEFRKIEQQAVNQANWDTWFEQRFAAAIMNPDLLRSAGFIDVLGKAQANTCKKLRREYETKFAAQEARIKQLEPQLSLEAKFFEMEHRLDARQLARDEAKRGLEMVPQSELLAKIEKLNRQVNEHESVADLDARFRELTERVGALEQTSSLEARFAKLAHELKNGSELPQSVLLTRIDGLQSRFDELKKIANQPGPPGPPGKLPRVKEYVAERVHYQSDVVTHAGALWQALGDTVHGPPHSDWICLARAGRNGSDGRSPNVCGTYDAREKYERLDIVALDGAAFIARRDNPGLCPSDGWQLLSRPGRPGRCGESGERGIRDEKGERGDPGATVVSWQLDRQRYRVSPLMGDVKVGPALELRRLFEHYHEEVNS